MKNLTILFQNTTGMIRAFVTKDQQLFYVLQYITVGPQSKRHLVTSFYQPRNVDIPDIAVELKDAVPSSKYLFTLVVAGVATLEQLKTPFAKYSDYVAYCTSQELSPMDESEYLYADYHLDMKTIQELLTVHTPQALLDQI